jgi:hypothetical protein
MGQFKIVWLCAFTLCIYLLIILIIGTCPFSDFRFYYEIALGILQEQSIPVAYKYFQAPGYPYLLSIILRIYHHSILLPQFLNALMLTMLLWVFLKYPLARYSVAIFVGYLILIFNVNYLGMVSVLCSEIPYAFFLLLGLFMFWWGFKRRLNDGSERNRSHIIPFLISGLFLGTSQFIRPVTFPYLLIFSLFMTLGFCYFTVEKMREGWKAVLPTNLRSLGFTWSAFFAGALMFYLVSGYGLTYAPPQKGLWNIYVGFNTESKWGWNIKDSELITRLGNKYNWEAEKVNEDFRPIVLERIKRNWKKNLRYLSEKLYKLMDPRGIPYWAIEQSRIKNKDMIYRVPDYLSYLNIIALIMSVGAWFTWLAKRQISQNEFFAFCMVGAAFSYLILHGYLFEVQPRYSNHLWLMMFWCYPLSQQVVWDRLLRIFRRVRE